VGFTRSSARYWLRRGAVVAALALAGCGDLATVGDAPAPCPIENHSGVCEEYAPLTAEALRWLDSARAADTGGNIHIGDTLAHPYPPSED